MIAERVFEIIYPNLKDYVETNSIYSPKVTKKQTLNSKEFPIVPVKLLPIENQYTTVNHEEEIETFGIDINVYAQDKTIGTIKYAKKTVCDEVTKQIVDFFKNNLKVTIRVEHDVINIDSSVHRNNIKITGKVDTKYGIDKLVIYPR